MVGTLLENAALEAASEDTSIPWKAGEKPHECENSCQQTMSHN